MKRAVALTLALAALPAAAQEAPSLIGTTLRSSDMEASLRFYTEGLGMMVAHKMPLAKGQEIILGFSKERPQPGIVLVSDETSGKGTKVIPGDGFRRIVVRVPDIQAMSKRLTKAGYPPSPIRDVAMGYRMMIATDPDGYRYELVESRRQAQDPNHVDK